MKQLISFILLIILLAFVSCTTEHKNTPEIKDGNLNLSQWDFEKDGIADLSGNWEFYWDRLYTNDSFTSGRKIDKPIFTKIPGTWNSTEVNGKLLPYIGFATYRLLVNLDSSAGLMAIQMYDASSAYKVWVNGVLVCSAGVVSANTDSIKSCFLSSINVFQKPLGKMELIVQVANNFHSKAGLWTTPQIGLQSQIINKRTKAIAFDFFLIGSFLILFMYHLLIYLLHRSESAALWFGLICLSSAIRILTTGERLLYVLIPNFQIDLGLKLEYLSIFVFFPISFTFFFYHLFREEFSKKTTLVYQMLISVMFFLICLTKASTYTQYVSAYQMTGLIGVIYFFVIIFKAIRNKKPLARSSLFSIFILSACAINDILVAALVIQSVYLLPVGVFFYLIFQAYLLASRINNNFRTIEDLSDNLSKANNNLEQKVIERTRELKYAKQKSDDLLLNILPSETAVELKETGRALPKTYETVSVMHAELLGNKNMRNIGDSALYVSEIDYCIRAFDEIAVRYNVEKIKTVGESYICAAGLPVLSKSHALDMLKAAREMRAFILQHKAQKEANGEWAFDLRIGIHTGSVVAGVVGARKFAFDIWGDTVNISNRLCENAGKSKINISKETYELVKFHFNCLPLEKIDISNIGETEVFEVK